MQKIPNISAEGLNVSQEVFKPSYGVDGYTFANELFVANQDKVPKKSVALSNNTQISYEEGIRLRNSLLEKGYITSNEAQMLTNLLYYGGTHTVEDIVDALQGKTQGFGALTPEEYVQLQQGLYTIGFSTEQITALNNAIMEHNTDTVLQKLQDQLTAFMEESPNETVPNFIGIVQKLFGQQNSTTATLELVQTDPKTLLDDIQLLRQSGTEGMKNTTVNIDNVEQMLAKVLQYREGKDVYQQYSSNKTERNTDAHAIAREYAVSKKAIGEIGIAESSETSDAQTTQGELAQGAEDSSLEWFAKNSDAFLSEQQRTTQIRTVVQAQHTRNTVPYQATTILEQVTAGFGSIRNNAARELIVELNPANLGKVEMVLQEHNGVMVATLRPEVKAVQNILEEYIPTLTKKLQEDGLKIEHIRVLEQNQQNNTQNYAFMNTPNDSSRNKAQEERLWYTQQKVRVARIRALCTQHVVQQDIGKRYTENRINYIV